MRIPAMLAVAMLSLAGCAPNAPLADEQPTFQQFRPDPVPPVHRDAQNDVDRGRVPLEEPLEDTTPSSGAVIRTAPPPPTTALPPIQHLPDAAFSQPFTPGPITGYGQGGMQHEPGTPPNPPYN
jgi:hypothetical protein